MSPCCHGNLCFGRVIENVIKYDLYVKFAQIFAHNIQICAKFSCKNFADVCPVSWILRHYTKGGGCFFVDTLYLPPKVLFFWKTTTDWPKFTWKASIKMEIRMSDVLPGCSQEGHLRFTHWVLWEYAFILKWRYINTLPFLIPILSSFGNWSMREQMVLPVYQLSDMSAEYL